MTYWHGSQRLTADVKLQGRDTPDLETDPARLVALVAQESVDRLEALHAAFANASESAAAFRPAADAWSAKEVLGHIVASELWGRGFTMATAFGVRSGDFWPERYEEVLRRQFQEAPAADAVAATDAEIRASWRLNRDLLTNDPAPPVLHRIASTVHHAHEHFGEHVAQIRAAIAAAP